VAVWARDHFGLSPEDYNLKVQCYKRLTLVWASPEIQASHPDAASGARWDQSNTVLVDDSPEKARSEPFNFICVPEFAGNVHEQPAYILPQIHDYINTLASQADVSRFVRASPFVPRRDYTL
jgi:hypothetical protein